MSKPAEILLFEFLTDAIDAAVPESVFYALELHDTVYQAITRDRGLRISDSVGEFGPQAGGGVKEYDVQLTIAAFAKVDGQDQKARQPALIDVFEIQEAVVALLVGDPTLGGRVCDLLVRRSGRGYDSYDGQPYAVANIPLVINPSGASYAGE